MNKNFNLVMFRLLGFVIALVFTLAACNQVASPVEATIGVTALDDKPNITGFELDKRVALVGQIVTANGVYEPTSATSVVSWEEGSIVNNLPSPFAISHTYTAAGDYEVELTVRVENDIATATADVTVYASREDFVNSLIEDVDEVKDLVRSSDLHPRIERISLFRLNGANRSLTIALGYLNRDSPRKAGFHVLVASYKLRSLLRYLEVQHRRGLVSDQVLEAVSRITSYGFPF